MQQDDQTLSRPQQATAFLSARGRFASLLQPPAACPLFRGRACNVCARVPKIHHNKKKSRYTAGAQKYSPSGRAKYVDFDASQKPRGAFFFFSSSSSSSLLYASCVSHVRFCIHMNSKDLCAAMQRLNANKTEDSCLSEESVDIFRHSSVCRVP